MRTYPANWTRNYIIAYGILGSVSDIVADKVYDYHTAFHIKPTKMKMNLPLDMEGNIINNSPSVKTPIFASPVKFNSSIDGKYVHFGGTSVIITPVKRKMTKCLFYSKSNLRYNLWLFVLGENTQNQQSWSYSCVGNKNKYQIFNT